MNEHLDPTGDQLSPQELDLEKKLRPLTFEDFTGQVQAIENLQVFVQAANLRSEALDHTLFHGPPGLGKTTLAQIVARELGVNFRMTSGPVLARAGATSSAGARRAAWRPRVGPGGCNALPSDSGDVAGPGRDRLRADSPRCRRIAKRRPATAQARGETVTSNGAHRTRSMPASGRTTNEPKQAGTSTACRDSCRSLPPAMTTPPPSRQTSTQ